MDEITKTKAQIFDVLAQMEHLQQVKNQLLQKLQKLTNEAKENGTNSNNVQ